MHLQARIEGKFRECRGKEAPWLGIMLAEGETHKQVQDGAVATENMLLAAHALGLGACWIKAYDMKSEADAKRILGIPDEERLLSVISVGHPAETPQQEEKQLEEITYTSRCGLRPWWTLVRTGNKLGRFLGDRTFAEIVSVLADHFGLIAHLEWGRTP